jgi:3',5'-cyclic AMP phosphodiesterase CpdA
VPFFDEPEAFRFAIIGDRTGGHRPGVFEDALGKLNLMKPEFVISVGDQIEGYTDDPARIDQQWNEFESFMGKLDMPFFFIAGNHDISNPLMADV